MFHILELWYFCVSVIYSHWFRSQICYNALTFCIATIFVKYCSTTGSWLLSHEDNNPRFRRWHECVFDITILLCINKVSIHNRMAMSNTAHSCHRRNPGLLHSCGCYNLWANIRCSGCSALGEKSLWNRTIPKGRFDLLLVSINHDNMVELNDSFARRYHSILWKIGLFSFRILKLSWTVLYIFSLDFIHWCSPKYSYWGSM